MYQNLKNPEYVRGVIATAFADLHDIFKKEIQAQYKNLNTRQRANAGRVLVLLSAVAKNPAKYFSREETEGSWFTRAVEYAGKHGVDDLKHAYYFVPSPDMLVTQPIQSWVGSDINIPYPVWRILWDLCKFAKDWEYEPHYPEARARDIVDLAKKIHMPAEIIRANPVKAMALKFVHNFQK